MGREVELLKGCRAESGAGSDITESGADGRDTVKAQIAAGAEQETVEVPSDGPDDRRIH